MPFQPGESGNPSGRQARQRTAASFRKAIAEHSDDILKTVIEAAKGGDMQAARMLLDRITPPLKAPAVSIALAHRETLSDQRSEVVKAIMKGAISPDIGSQWIAVLGAQAKIFETDELMKRVQALESRINESA